MNKGVILSLLVAGLITGSYIEFQVNQRDDAVDVIEARLPGLPFETVEPSPPVGGNFLVEGPDVESTVIRFLRVEPTTTQVIFTTGLILEGSGVPLGFEVTQGSDIRFRGGGHFQGVFVAPGYLGKVTVAFDLYRDGKWAGNAVVEGYRPTLRITPRQLLVRGRPDGFFERGR